MTPSGSGKRKRKRRRKREENWGEFERLKAKLEQGAFHGDKLVVAPSGQVKMSEVLGDFVEPYMDLVDTEQAYRRLLTLAVVAWNASLLSEEEQQEMVDRVLEAGIPSGDDELRGGLKGIVNMLIARKREHFSEHNRHIIDFEVTDTGEAYHLTVASMLDEQA